MIRFIKANTVITLVVALVVVGVVGGVLAFAAVVQSRAHQVRMPPPDSKMISYFQKHEREFAELLKTYQTDRDLEERLFRLVASDPSLQNSSSQMPKSEDVQDPTLKAYLDLMERLGIHSVSPRHEGGVEFITSWLVLRASSWYKGYLYSDRPPTPLVSSIPQAEPRKDSGRLCRHVEGNWYLVYEWSN